MTTTRSRGGAALALALLPWAVACVAAGSGGPPRIDQPARDYVATTLEGDTVSLSDLEGQVVLLNLWATWCAPCRAETPYLQSIYEERRDDGFVIVGVSMDTGSDVDDIEMFVEEYGVSYTILHDPKMIGMETYQVLGLPATFLIDRDGVLRWMRYGPIQEGDPDFLRALDDAIS